MSKKILFVLTNHALMGNTGESTGYHLAEAARPYNLLQDAGYEIDFASPAGGKPPVDHFDLEDKDNLRFWEDKEVQGKLSATKTPEMVNPANYAAIYFAGGHGTMWDFPHNLALQELTAKIYESGGVVAAICHGPAALVNVKLSDGSYLVDGKKVNSFTDEEERLAQKENVVPFLLESSLRNRGARFQNAEPGECCVIVDDRLITGQNPASAKAIGQKIDEVLSRIPAAK